MLCDWVNINGSVNDNQGSSAVSLCTSCQKQWLLQIIQLGTLYRGRCVNWSVISDSCPLLFLMHNIVKKFNWLIVVRQEIGIWDPGNGTVTRALLVEYIFPTISDLVYLPVPSRRLCLRFVGNFGNNVAFSMYQCCSSGNSPPRGSGVEHLACKQTFRDSVLSIATYRIR